MQSKLVGSSPSYESCWVIRLCVSHKVVSQNQEWQESQREHQLGYVRENNNVNEYFKKKLLCLPETNIFIK